MATTASASEKHGQNLDAEAARFAFDHPLRWAIYRQLADGRVASAQDIARAIGKPVENVSYHVRRLHDRGLIRQVATEQRRGRVARLYTADLVWITDEAWAQLPKPTKRRIAVRQLAAFTRELRKAAEQGGFDRSDVLVSNHRLSLSPAEWDALRRAVDELDEHVRTFPHRDLTGRSAGGEEPRVKANVVLMMFEESGDESDY